VPKDTRVWNALPASLDHCDLGEGARWSAHTSELVNVDLTAGVCRFSNFTDGQLRTTREIVVDGYFALVEPLPDGGYVACYERTVEWWDSSFTKNIVSDIPLGPNERLNDGGISPDGHLIVGSMGLNGEAGLGKLWLVEKGAEPRILRSGDGIPNGIAWDVSRSRAYWVDSSAGLIYVFEIKGTGIDWMNPLESWPVGDASCSPDGLTLDSSGNVWVAMWGGSRVDAYSPDGELFGRVVVPASLTTSCVFGGEDMRSLFVTTALFKLTEDQLAMEPEAGRIFVASIGEIHE
jgi:sugar lactone lactonase YvrE